MPEVNPQRVGNGQHEEGLAALHRRDARSRLIIEQALDAIITLDANGHITDWNPQAERILGWSQHEVVGRSFTETIFPLSIAKTILADFDSLWKQEKEPC